MPAFGIVIFAVAMSKPNKHTTMGRKLIITTPWVKRNTIFLTALLLAAVLLIATDSAAVVHPRAERFTVEPDSAAQQIKHFGASDAWSLQRVGLFSEAEQLKAADWLFSLDTDNSGKPKGIGLSVWRFNLGAGSAEQGDSSHINKGTRTECFLSADGSYCWTKQAGQRRFLHLAKERGVGKFHAFLNSAPVYFTKNGLATNTGRGGTINLKDDCYDRFASFIATSIEGLERHDGIRIDYISPVNEPDGSWNWLGPKQEGSPATNREVAHLVKALDKQLNKKKLSSEIIVNESSDLRCVLGTHNTDWTRGYALNTFFNRYSSKTYLGNLKHVPMRIAAHSYWTNTPISYMRDIRKQLRRECQKLGVSYWQTEICIMGNDKEIGGGSEYDFSMKTALYVARVIHHDLVYGNAESWSWWRAIGGNYKDGLLRSYDNADGSDGYIVDSKLLWALGNYSRFVRPDAVRYGITALDEQGDKVPEGYNDVDGVMASAFRNTDGHWVVVAINYATDMRPFNFSVRGKQLEWLAYRTSDISAESLAPVGTTSGNCTLPPRSITTFVSK